MGKGKKQKKQVKLADGSVATLPKSKCCESRSRCKRCPIRMLKDGTMPPGYSVHKRRLVKVSKKQTGKKPGSRAA